MQTTTGSQKPEQIDDNIAQERDHGAPNHNSQTDHVLASWQRAVGNHVIQRMSQHGSWPERLIKTTNHDEQP